MDAKPEPLRLECDDDALTAEISQMWDGPINICLESKFDFSVMTLSSGEARRLAAWLLMAAEYKESSDETTAA